MKIKHILNNSFSKKSNGFSLVEVLVTLFVFSLIITITMGIFVSVLKMQKRAQSAIKISNEASYAMEYMSRAIRMAQYDENGNCGANLNYEKTSDGIKFKGYDGKCRQFSCELDSGGTNVYRLKEIIDNGGVLQENYLTSSELNIVSFNVGPEYGWNPTDDIQPRITISLEIKGITKNPAELKIQTTLSQRNIDRH
ncbi:MAG: prepilin-type N-terminal cleavage/methylation domain-containing protein [Patescibacteria group bacterium]|nr:prepilin-type N-terminal cleavage/methylation domain-containing protein [Patescibacteria group bacterium]